MARLIDVDKALEKLRKVEPKLKVVSIVGIKAVSIDGFIDFLERQKTVDAVEVVHGRWAQVDHDGSWRVDMCSICHRRMHYVDYDQPYQYCPNCGAKMDGDGNG